MDRRGHEEGLEGDLSVRGPVAIPHMNAVRDFEVSSSEGVVVYYLAPADSSNLATSVRVSKGYST